MVAQVQNGRVFLTRIEFKVEFEGTKEKELALKNQTAIDMKT